MLAGFQGLNIAQTGRWGSKYVSSLSLLGFVFFMLVMIGAFAVRSAAGFGAVLIAMPMLASGHQDPTSAHIIRVVAERFLFTPSEITVDEGEVVELRITSEDTSHGFHLKGPDNINVEIP